MTQLIENLIENGVKYSPAGGEVRVHVWRENGHANLTVSEDGIGIPPADLPKLFEPFYRASNAVGQKPGTGLGLAGARHIVEQHGGRIEVESTEGVGSTFRVRLPAAAR